MSSIAARLGAEAVARPRSSMSPSQRLRRILRSRDRRRAAPVRRNAVSQCYNVPNSAAQHDCPAGRLAAGERRHDIPRMGESSQGSDGGDEARRHREIIAAFGIKALQGGDLDVLLTEACQHVSNGLGVEHARSLEYRAESDDVLVRAGIGWAEGVVGRATLGTDMASPPGRAFRS